MNSAHMRDAIGKRQVMSLITMWWGQDLTHFPFWFDVKFSKTTKARHFFRPTASMLEWWNKTKLNAAEDGKSPLLVIKAEGVWYCIQPLSMSMSSVGSVLTRKFGDDQVEIMTIDDFMLNFEDANPSRFGRKPELTVKTKKKTA